MTGKVPFDSLRFRPQRRTYAQRQSLRDVEGFDTETEKGYARIAANSQAWTEIAGIDDVFSCLLNKRHRDTINVLWNLSFDVECLFKWSKDILTQFAQSGEATYDDYELHYIKGKCLSIRDKAKHTYRFFDIAQFYLSSLAKATVEYLHEEPHEFKSSRATLFQDHPLPAIGNYCAQDARQTRDLGTLLMHTIQKIGLSSNRPYSCGYLAQDFSLRNADVPTMKGIPRPVLRMYWQAYRGGWFDTYQRGYGKITSYDISSAYPWALTQLPNVQHGKWVRGVHDKSNLGVAAVTLNAKVPVSLMVPANTYIATILAILATGHRPVLVEPDISTYNIDPKKISDAISPKTGAILVVHLYGKSCDMQQIMEIATKHNIPVIEDAAQAHGAAQNGRKVGTFGELAAWSFYPTKNLGCLGDGGAITTAKGEHAERLCMLRNYGQKTKYFNEVVGENSRLDEVQAAFLRIKLRRLDEINAHKRRLAEIYFSELSADFILPKREPGFEDIFHIFNIRHPERDRVQSHLAERGIQTLVHYPVAPHRQKCMEGHFAEDQFPISEEIHQTTLSLPISFYHQEPEIMEVVRALNEF